MPTPWDFDRIPGALCEASWTAASKAALRSGFGVEQLDDEMIAMSQRILADRTLSLPGPVCQGAGRGNTQAASPGPQEALATPWEDPQQIAREPRDPRGFKPAKLPARPSPVRVSITEQKVELQRSRPQSKAGPATSND